jgi:hypothetical protein
VSGVQEAPPPERELFRVARRPDPFVLPAWNNVGAERFDDPARRFRTLYVADTRLACFLETLQAFRPTPANLERWNATRGPDEQYPPPAVPDDWHVRRVVGRVRIDGPMPLLDARAFATCTVLRADLASTLVRLKLPDLDPSTVRGPYRELTQEIAGWAYDRGYQGIVYRSRFDDGLSEPLDCLALFGVDGIAQVRPVGVDPIRRDDPDLLLAATQHRLAL